MLRALKRRQAGGDTVACIYVYAASSGNHTVVAEQRIPRSDHANVSAVVPQYIPPFLSVRNGPHVRGNSMRTNNGKENHNRQYSRAACTTLFQRFSPCAGLAENAAPYQPCGVNAATSPAVAGRNVFTQCSSGASRSIAASVATSRNGGAKQAETKRRQRSR
jgi:hypothetical protein